MTAQEFIKQYGWGEAKKHLKFMEDVKARRDIHGWFMDDLKQLVDAWELVNRVGNIIECKRLLSMLERSNIPHMTFGGELNGREIEQRVLTTDFKQAIELVESVK